MTSFGDDIDFILSAKRTFYLDYDEFFIIIIIIIIIIKIIIIKIIIIKIIIIKIIIIMKTNDCFPSTLVVRVVVETGWCASSSWLLWVVRWFFVVIVDNSNRYIKIIIIIIII